MGTSEYPRRSRTSGYPGRGRNYVVSTVGEGWTFNVAENGSVKGVFDGWYVYFVPNGRGVTSWFGRDTRDFAAFSRNIRLAIANAADSYIAFNNTITNTFGCSLGV